MRIMTSNIWGDFFGNPAKLRKDNIYKVYQKYNPDIIGFQEAAAGWYDTDLFSKLGKNYNLVGTELCNNTNSTPLAIKKEYTIISKGHEQLLNTPDKSKSITWAVIENDSLRVAVCNTHFWWMRGSEPENVKKIIGVLDYTFEDHCNLRADNAKQLSALMHYLYEKHSCPVFAFGDMNATISESVFNVYEENDIKMLFDMTMQKDSVCSVHGDPLFGNDGLFHGKKATKESVNEFRKVLCLPEERHKNGAFSSIDHIIALGRGFKVLQYRIVEDQEALDATDHSPVFADIEF